VPAWSQPQGIVSASARSMPSRDAEAGGRVGSHGSSPSRRVIVLTQMQIGAQDGNARSRTGQYRIADALLGVDQQLGGRTIGLDLGGSELEFVLGGGELTFALGDAAERIGEGIAQLQLDRGPNRVRRCGQ
jgi:hypothetical protein